MLIHFTHSIQKEVVMPFFHAQTMLIFIPACNCDYRGSYDNLCDVQTGQCKCNDLGTGRQCNECPPREWGFPICRPCECNGHASTCDPVTGVCIECQHNTAGDKCELCKAGYFGNATKGESNISIHNF